MRDSRVLVKKRPVLEPGFREVFTSLLSLKFSRVPSKLKRQRKEALVQSEDGPRNFQSCNQPSRPLGSFDVLKTSSRFQKKDGSALTRTNEKIGIERAGERKTYHFEKMEELSVSARQTSPSSV